MFDPLAIVLVIAANLSIKERRGERITPMNVPDEAVDYVQEDWDEPEQEHSDPIIVDIDNVPTPQPKKKKKTEDWVEKKYGSESAMDPKKEVDLQWLIDKKKQEKDDA